MRKLAICATITCLAVLACCNETPTEPPPPPPWPQNDSPVGVLRYVEISFNNRDFEFLKAALNGNFVFYFDPDDVGETAPGGNYRIPESWTYTEFWQAVSNMFDRAHSISLSIATGNVGTPGESETTFKAENITINLLVMIDELNGFRAGDYGYCNFAFERYDGEGGKKLWRLTGWWDRTAARSGDSFAGSEPESVGRIFAMFK